MIIAARKEFMEKSPIQELGMSRSNASSGLRLEEVAAVRQPIPAVPLHYRRM